MAGMLFFSGGDARTPWNNIAGTRRYRSRNFCRRTLFVFAYGLNTSKTRMRVIAESPYRVLKSVGAKGDFGHADGCV